MATFTTHLLLRQAENNNCHEQLAALHALSQNCHHLSCPPCTWQRFPHSSLDITSTCCCCAAATAAHPYRVQNTAADWIAANLGAGPVIKEKFMSSSSWSSAYLYTTEAGQEFFVKLAMGGRDDSMFQGEAQGLQAMYGEPRAGKGGWVEGQRSVTCCGLGNVERGRQQRE